MSRVRRGSHNPNIGLRTQSSSVKRNGSKKTITPCFTIVSAQCAVQHSFDSNEGPTLLSVKLGTNPPPALFRVK